MERRRYRFRTRFNFGLRSYYFLEHVLLNEISNRFQVEVEFLFTARHSVSEISNMFQIIEIQEVVEVDTVFNRRHVGRDIVMPSSEISSTFLVRKEVMVHCYFLPKPEFHLQTPVPPFSNKSRSCCCEP